MTHSGEIYLPNQYLATMTVDAEISANVWQLPEDRREDFGIPSVHKVPLRQGVEDVCKDNPDVIICTVEGADFVVRGIDGTLLAIFPGFESGLVTVGDKTLSFPDAGKLGWTLVEQNYGGSGSTPTETQPDLSTAAPTDAVVPASGQNDIDMCGGERVCTVEGNDFKVNGVVVSTFSQGFFYYEGGYYVTAEDLARKIDNETPVLSNSTTVDIDPTTTVSAVYPKVEEDNGILIESILAWSIVLAVTGGLSWALIRKLVSATRSDYGINLSSDDSSRSSATYSWSWPGNKFIGSEANRSEYLKTHGTPAVTVLHHAANFEHTYERYNHAMLGALSGQGNTDSLSDISDDALAMCHARFMAESLPNDIREREGRAPSQEVKEMQGAMLEYRQLVATSEATYNGPVSNWQGSSPSVDSSYDTMGPGSA